MTEKKSLTLTKFVVMLLALIGAAIYGAGWLNDREDDEFDDRRIECYAQGGETAECLGVR